MMGILSLSSYHERNGIEFTMGKKYSQYMDEISADVLYEKLLAYGFFSEKLPPIFDSVSFAKVCIESNCGFSGKEYYDYIRYNSMRNINIPRQLGIPVPMAYERLCNVITKNWKHIQQHFHKQTDSQNFVISRLHLQLSRNNPALFIMNYEDWRNGGSPQNDLAIGNKFMVKSDISNCFPSIYTHSIPWALLNKDTAKLTIAKQQDNSNKWCNDIDKACQNMKYKETHGLLIGPHASNLISEIILTVVDKKLYDKGWRYIRYIDDYTCFVESEEKADNFIHDLGQELEKFDLRINYKKTKIQRLPDAGITDWVSKIKRLNFMFSDRLIKYPDAQAFSSAVIELMDSNNHDSAIFKYAIKMLKGYKLTENARIYIWKIWMQLCLIYPYLITLMEEFIFQPFHPPVENIRDFANQAFNQGLKARNYEECCYALLFSIDYNFKIDSLKMIDVLDASDCLFKLISAIYFRRIKDDDSFTQLKEYAKTLKENKNNFDRNWIFVYEMLTAQELDNQSGWYKMKKARISFLKDKYKL